MLICQQVVVLQIPINSDSIPVKSVRGESTHGESTHGESTHGESTHGESTHGESTQVDQSKAVEYFRKAVDRWFVSEPTPRYNGSSHQKRWKIYGQQRNQAHLAFSV